MQIFVDADSNPNAVREILFRAVERTGTPLFLVANQPMKVPRSAYIRSITVPAGPDEADDRIVELVREGDLVVTADIPLADRVIRKGGRVIGPRGELFSAENIKERLAIRDLMDDLRSIGMDTGGPAVFSHKDRRAFANQLDRLLTKEGVNPGGEE